LRLSDSGFMTCVRFILVLVFSSWTSCMWGIGGLPHYTVLSNDKQTTVIASSKLLRDQANRIIAIDEGMMFAYDGTRWSNVIERNMETVDWVLCARYSKGSIYSGTIGNWGELDITGEGIFKFRSIADPLVSKTVSDCRLEEVAETGDGGIFFYGPQGAVWVDGKGEQTAFPRMVFSHVMVEGSHTTVFSTDGSYFSLEADVPEKLRKLGSTADLSPIVGSFQMERERWCVSRSGKFLRWTEGRLETRPVNPSQMQGKEVRLVTSMGDDMVAFAFYQEGVMILGPHFETLTSIPSSVDHRFAMISSMAYDPDGILWVALQDGLAKVFWPSSVTVVDYRLGMDIQWPYPLEIENGLVVFGGDYLLSGEPDPDWGLWFFQRLNLPGISNVAWMEATDHGYLMLADGKLFEVDSAFERMRLISEVGYNEGKLVKFPEMPEYVVYLGMKENYLLAFTDGSWRVKGEALPTTGYPFIVTPGPHHDLWIENGVGKVSRAWLNGGNLQVEAYSPAPYLPERWVTVFLWDNEVYVKNFNKLARFDYEQKSFEPVPTLPFSQFDIGNNSTRPAKDRHGDMWIPDGEGVFILNRSDDGEWAPDYRSVELIQEPSPVLFFSEQNNTVYSRSQRRLNVIENGLHPPSIQAPEVVIRSVIPLGADALWTNWTNSTDTPPPLELKWGQNSFTVQFAFGSQYFLQKPEFQYRVVGLSSNWSDVSADNSITFNRIPVGNYRLEIHRIDGYGRASGDTRMIFSVKAPWFMSWWAKTLMGLLSSLLIWGLVEFFGRRAIQDKIRLERLVSERTEALSRSHRELQTAFQLVNQASHAKDQFLANMSHELRTPINGIVGSVELIQHESSPELRRELIQIVMHSSRHLMGIINDILDFSKIESGRVEICREWVVLDELVQRQLEQFSFQLREKDVELYQVSDDAARKSCYVDPLRLNQVLGNLILNACKFTDRGEIEVSIGFTQEDEESCCLQIAVHDTGIGIHSSDIGRLFAPFVQVDASDSRRHGGTGLGLVICDRLTRLMGGTISVESVPDVGSCFKVKLSGVPYRRDVIPMNRVKRRVWLLDTCMSRRDYFRKCFEASAVELEVFDSLESCYQAEAKPDYLVCPMRMQTEQLSALLNKVNSSCQVIACCQHPLATDAYPGVKVLHYPMHAHGVVLLVQENPDLLQHQVAEEQMKDDANDGLRILLVEDNLTNQKVATLMLRKLGHTCILACDGATAIDTVSKEPFDVILMDIQMPGIDGIEAARRIRKLELQRQPVIIALTAGAMKGERENALASGMDGFISKPVTLETLEMEINRLAQAPGLGSNF